MRKEEKSTFARCLGIKPSSANCFRTLNGKRPSRMCHLNISRCSEESFALILGHEEGSSWMRCCSSSRTNSGNVSESEGEGLSNWMKSCVVEISEPSSSLISNNCLDDIATMRPLKDFPSFRKTTRRPSVDSWFSSEAKVRLNSLSVRKVKCRKSSKKASKDEKYVATNAVVSLLSIFGMNEGVWWMVRTDLLLLQ